MKNLNKKIFLLCCYVSITMTCILSAPAAMAELIKNGDFSNGNSSWNTQNMTVFQNMGVGGSSAMQTACAGHQCVDNAGAGAFFSQVLDTVAGTSYKLSFFVGESEGPTGEFSVFWDGVQLADIINPASGTVDFHQNPHLVEYDFDLLATAASTVLEFHGRQDPGRMSFDNISVVEKASNVPESGSLPLVLLGSMAMVAVRRRKWHASHMGSGL